MFGPTILKQRRGDVIASFFDTMWLLERWFCFSFITFIVMTIIVLCVSLTMPAVGLQCLIVALTSHSHLLFQAPTYGKMARMHHDVSVQ